MTNDIQQMEIVKAVKLFFENYFNFSGRASRGEFWWAYLAFIIASILVSIVDAVLGGIVYGITGSSLLLNSGFLVNILSLATFIGWVSLTARRLQDRGWSGWWQLLYLTIVGILVIVVLNILPAKEDENKWGRNPLL